jgi:1,4-dihydroxy-2-naphthoate octaprenyltransferase
MFSTGTLKLLRIPFSFFLMPVFLFALSQSYRPDAWNVFLVFVVLHLFVYPASNIYNSYMDQDEGSIGGLRNPPKVTREALYASVLFDLAGLGLSLLVNVQFFICVLVYMLASKAYSYTGIRLKKYPLVSFFTVVFFQGYFTFYMCYSAFGNVFDPMSDVGYAAAGCLFLIGGVYPLTQIYQHEEDARHGDKTISRMMGYTGTFIFTAAMFVCASILLYTYFSKTDRLMEFFMLQGFLFPVVIYFSWWALKAMKNHVYADFDHTMRMNMIAAGCMNTCFILLTVLNYIS